MSLRNEKGLKRQAKAKCSTDPCRNSGNSVKRTTYSAIYRSCDDELNKESARAPEEHEVSRRDASATRGYVPKGVHNTCDANKKRDATSGEVQKNDVKHAQEHAPSPKTKLPGINADMSAKDSKQKESKESVASQHGDKNVQRRLSSKHKPKVSPLVLNPDKTRKRNSVIRAPNSNGNLAFVKRLPPSRQHAESFVEDTMSTLWNLEDVGKDERLLIEYAPLSRASNKATLLPPIKSSLMPSSNLDNTVELRN